MLYLDDPPGVDRATRREMLDAVAALNKMKHQAYGDPEIETRIAQYEMAYRMQTSVPELMDLSKEPDSTFELYGPDCAQARAPTPPTACSRAGWPSATCGSSSSITAAGTSTATCRATSRCSARAPTSRRAALITDLKQRGLLDDTLVIWGGEFGRTVFSQGRLTDANYGRDHHPRNFCMWVAGGGTKRGTVIGETDDFSYNVVSDPVSVYDLQATLLHLMGIDHKKLTYRFQGRDFRLTDVHGEVVEKMLA